MRGKKGSIPSVVLMVICGVWSFGIGGIDGDISVNSTSSSVLRYIRATNDDKMVVAVDQMQKVARLATGISIQLGLISGSIQADPLISELLRLGNVTPSEIVALDAGKLTGAMDGMRKLPETLEASKGIEEIEAKLEKIEEVRKLVKEAGDGKTWVGKKEFLEEVDFVNDNMDAATIERTTRQFSNWISNMEGLVGLKKKGSKNFAAAKRFIDNIIKDTEDIETEIADFKTLDGSQWRYPKMESAVGSLKPLTSISEAVVQSQGHHAAVVKAITNEDKVFESSKKNIEEVSKLSSSLNNVVADLKKVETIVRSRGFPEKKGLEYPGFLNGFWDIDRLFDDLSDDWMAQVVKVNSMTVSLKPLKSLLLSFKPIDKAFGSYKSEKITAISKYLEYVEDIQKVRADSSAITKAVDGFWGCKTSFEDIDKPPDADLTKFLNLATKLDENMKHLKDNLAKFEDTVDAQGVAQMFSDVKKLCSTVSANAKDISVINTILNSKEVIGLEKVLKKAEDAMTEAKTAAKKATSLAGEIINSTRKVDDYIDSLHKYHTLFNCLHGLDDQKSKLVVEGMKISQKFRNADNEVVTDGEEVVKGVVDSIEGFKKLKVAIGNMKNQKVEHRDALKRLSVKQSKVIGAAVRGVSAMKEALEKKVHADVIILNSGVVETQMKLAKLEQADVKNLNSVVQLKSPLTTMYQKLDVWRKGVSEVKAERLVNSFNMFSTAKSVPGVTGNLGAMAKSVDSLIKSITDNSAKKKLVSVKKALESLDTFGLDFASYSTQFDASKDALSALDLFYANHTTRMTSLFDSSICEKKKDVCKGKGCKCDVKPSTITYFRSGVGASILFGTAALTVIPLLSYLAYLVCCQRKKAIEIEENETGTSGDTTNGLAAKE